MNIKEDEIRNCFYPLSINRKLYLLSLLAYEITICARGAYPAQGQVQDNESISKLCTFNEVQHRITAKLAHMIAKDNERDIDETFLAMLFRKARDGGCMKDLVVAFNFAFKNSSLVE